MLNINRIKNKILQDLSSISPSSFGNIAFIDDNLALEHALGLGRTKPKDDINIYYSILNYTPYPAIEDEISGYGFNEIVKTQEIGAALLDSEYVFIPDIGLGSFIDFLKVQNYKVFGAPSEVEKLETDRIYAKEILQKYGISIPEYTIANGINELKEIIKNSDSKVYIKLNKYRGAFETFGTDSVEEVEYIISSSGLNIFGDNIQFIVEKAQSGIEIGIDTWFNGTDFIPVVAETIEIKGAGNATSFKNITESIWNHVLQKIKPYLIENNYVGMFCLEGFFDGVDIKIIDITPRTPYPSSLAYPKVVRNYYEFIVGIMDGKLSLPDIPYKYSVQIDVYTDSTNKWKKIYYDRDDIEWLAFRRVIKKNNDECWFVPGDSLVAVGISEADDIDSAAVLAIERADAVSAIDIYTPGYDFFVRLQKTLTKGKELGYEF